MKLKTSSLLIAATLMGAAVMPAQADNDAMVNLLKVLRDKGTISDSDYNALVSAAKEDAKATAEVKKVAKSMPKIITKGKIKFESPDGHWSFQPIGRVMWDMISVDGKGDGSNDYKGSELRRARLGFEGDIYDWGYKFEADFAKAGKNGSSVAIKDAFVSYGTKFGDSKFKVKLGQSQIAFGFNTAASSKYMTFMDRPWYADESTSPARESGIAAKLSSHRWSLASSITFGGLKAGEAEDSTHGTRLSVRGTVVPYFEDKHHQFQIGAGYTTVGDNSDSYSFSNHLSSHADPVKIKSATLNTSAYGGNDAYEFDAVGIFGPFHVLGEYNSLTADNNAGRDIDIDSYSIEAGYYLTGESMKLKHGLWDGVTPKSSMGAWQIAARFENTDIKDGVNNEKADMWTIGLNYIPVKNIRLMLDYSDVTKFEKGGVGQTEPSAIKFRAQAKW